MWSKFLWKIGTTKGPFGKAITGTVSHFDPPKSDGASQYLYPIKNFSYGTRKAMQQSVQPLLYQF